MSVDAHARMALNQLAASAPAPTKVAAERAIRQLDEPLRVAIAGRVKAGKSTLLNALIGRAAAATDAGECTRIVTWYQHHPHDGVWIVGRDGVRRDGRLTGERDAPIDLRGVPESDVARLEVGLAAPELRRVTLIDTPGIASANVEISGRSHDLLDSAAESDSPDVLVFCLRYLHEEDSRMLEAFSDPSAAAADPVRSLAVLSRADEIGAGRGDSLAIAQQVASSYRTSSAMRNLVTDVFPVSGLLAFAASTHSQLEYDSIQSVAALSPSDRDRLLASTDRFAAPSNAGPSASERAALLRRYGLFGVRYAVAAITAGRVRTASELAAELLRASGVEALREVILERYASRSAALKASRALDVAAVLAASLDRAEATTIRKLIQRARADEIQLRELDTIRAVVSSERTRIGGGGGASSIDRATLLRILGNEGDAITTRLGVSSDASEEDLERRIIGTRGMLDEALGLGFVSDEEDRILHETRETVDSLLGRLSSV